MRFVIAFALLVGFTTPGFLHAQTGKVFDNLAMKSAILKMDRRYAVYLPPDYETSARSYPVLYLLHGGGDDQTGWIQFGEVLHMADEAIREGKATPMVIVMPDASAGRMSWYNSVKGDFDYEEFFFKEFMPHVEKQYRIKAEKRYRAVAGLSMGGGGSFIYALHHPELFSSACPLSAYCGPMAPADVRAFFERFTPEIKYSDEEVDRYYKQFNVPNLINTLPVEGIKSVRWFIDCGDDDFLFEGNSMVHIAMKKKGIPHEFRIRDGGHTWTYWRESLPHVLNFVSQAFHQY